MTQDDPWANLPGVPLLTIIRRIDLDERFSTIPLICKSWKSISQHPQYWSSMIPDSISPEHAFIGQRCPSFPIKHRPLRLWCRPPEARRQADLGISRLESLIKKSGGGDAITSLYLSPFIRHQYAYNMNDHEIITNTYDVIRLVADCCPNLKHISFYHCYEKYGVTELLSVSEEALIELISKCKKLELVDFDYIRCIQYSSSFLQKLANCLPNLRGIRIQARSDRVIWSCPLAQDIAKYLLRLKLLNLAESRVNGEDLTSILSGCRELQYLNIEGSAMLNIHIKIYDPNAERSIRERCLVYQASAQIPYFYFDTIRPKGPCKCSSCCPDIVEKYWSVE